MRRYEILHIFARRLGLKVGRAQAILSRLQEAGTISAPGDNRFQPADMHENEVVTLLIALLGESGIANGPVAATTFGSLTTEDGERFDVFLSNLLFGQPRAVRHLLVRQSPPGVSVIIDGMHVLFGQPPSRTNASPARIVAGETLSAITAELQGQSPEQAETLAALSSLRRPDWLTSTI